MKTIGCWADMNAHGIVPLTVEPDGPQYRIVCDVTPDGKRLIERVFGIVAICLETNRAHGGSNAPHIGSIMLSPDTLSLIGIYALLDAGCYEVWMTKNCGLVGLEQCDSPEELRRLQLRYGKNLACRFSGDERISSQEQMAAAFTLH